MIVIRTSLGTQVYIPLQMDGSSYYPNATRYFSFAGNNLESEIDPIIETG